MLSEPRNVPEGLREPLVSDSNKQAARVGNKLLKNKLSNYRLFSAMSGMMMAPLTVYTVLPKTAACILWKFWKMGEKEFMIPHPYYTMGNN